MVAQLSKRTRVLMPYFFGIIPDLTNANRDSVRIRNLEDIFVISFLFNV
jgi:hypothetical protein